MESVWKPLAPGLLREIPKTAKAFMGDEYEELMDGKFAKTLEAVTAGNVGSKNYSPIGQIIANLTGFRFEEVNIERSLEMKAKQYLRDFDEARKTLDDFGIGSKETGNDFLEALARANKKVYYAQKNFQLAYEAAEELGMDTLTRSQILDKANVPASIKNSMNYNSFQALLPSGTKYERFLEQNLQGPMGVQKLKYYVQQYKQTYDAIPMLDIGFTSQADDEDIPILRQVSKENIEFVRSPKSVSKTKAKIDARFKRSKGGLITGPDVVSYTKENPATRINPYTGEAYQEDLDFFDEIAQQFEDKK